MPPQAKINETEVLAFYARYREGESAAALGAEVGLSPQAIGWHFRRRGLAHRPRRRIPQEELLRLHVRYMAGEPISKLSPEAGYGRQGLSQAFSRNGLPVHPPGKRPMRPEDPRAREAIALWDSGMGLRRIQARIGLETRTLSRLLRETGRNPSDRLRGPGHVNWRGGRYIDTQGYVRVRVDSDHPMASMRNSNGEIREHRLAMAEALGRPLLSSETVHHVNGDGQDNRLENLQLRMGNHGSGGVFECADCGSHNIVASPI